MNRVFLFLIGAHFYYSYLFFKKVNNDDTPKIGAGIFSAKTIGLLALRIYEVLSSVKLAFSKGEFIFIGATLGIVITYLVYFKLGLGDFIINYFEKNISKKLFIIGIIYALLIDAIVLFAGSDIFG